MTREEAIEVIKAYKDKLTNSASNQLDGDIEAFDMAIKALEQEPKTGHWMEHDCESLREMGYYRCSECNHGYQRYERGVRKSEVPYINGQKYELHRIDNFCPNCGAKMESEVKE